jgi:uncharacterized delta-60 repeat protein
MVKRFSRMQHGFKRFGKINSPMKYINLILIATLILSFDCKSQSLSFDNSFATNGVWQDQKVSEISNIQLQSDGKILSAGYWIDSTISHWQVARHNANGNLDVNFANNGFALTSIGYYQDIAENIAIQADGKILAVGSYQDYQLGPYHTAICRYKINGQLDSTFGSNGIIRLTYGQQDALTSINIQSDHKILLGGSVAFNSAPSFSILRLNQDGTVDATFGNNGLTITNFNDPSVIYDMQLLSDGSILACGYEGIWSFGIGSNTRFAIAKYSSLGILQNSFGTNGFVLLNVNPASLDRATEIDIFNNGKILLSGFSQNGAAFVRMLANGMLDNTFGQNGIVSDNMNAIPTSTSILADGKILTLGSKPLQPFDYGFQINKMKTDGSMDSTFGVNGIFESNITGDADYGQDAILTAAGNYLCGGSSDGKNVLVRYTIGSPTSTSSIKNTPHFEVYPNPTAGDITIDFELEKNSLVTLELLNNLGQKVVTFYKEKQFKQGKNQLTLNTSSFASGNYFLSLQTKYCSQHKKISIQ